MYAMHNQLLCIINTGILKKPNDNNILDKENTTKIMYLIFLVSSRTCFVCTDLPVIEMSFVIFTITIVIFVHYECVSMFFWGLILTRGKFTEL